MKKFIALVLSIQLILLQVLPANAQLVQGAVRGAITQTLTQKTLPAFTQTLTKTSAYGALTATQAAQFATSTTSKSVALENTITRLTGNHVLNNWVRTETAFARAKFTSVLADKQPALDFWRNEISQKASQLGQLPANKFTPAALNAPEGKPTLQAANEVITDLSALGLLGTTADASHVLQAYKQVHNTPLAPVVAQVAAKVLLRLKAYAPLQTLLDISASTQVNWNGLKTYTDQQNIALIFPQAGMPNMHVVELTNKLGTFSPMAKNAVDGSAAAISWYVNVGLADMVTTAKATVKPAAQKAGKSAEIAPVVLPNLQALQLSTPAFASVVPAVQTPALPLENKASVPTAPMVDATPVSAVTAAMDATPASAATIIADDTGILYSGIPVPFLAQKFQALVEKAKQFLRKDKNVPEELKQDATFLQKASIYLASVVIGLEIGTPIMASLGSSLDLSLSEKILVTAATFLPYSIGSLISNWLKETFGRKASANIGLSLMAGSFITGVTALGLDGSFVPWDNSLVHFYSILASLMVASFGGVFIHNAVGPIMTELSKNMSEIIRQKRVSYTELVRAVGMLSSYAFPFIATTCLGMDWSSSFVMALPFVGLSAAAINFAKIPNTKPATVKPTEMAAGIRSRRGLSWKQTLLDNNYLRLFKEDKSVAPLITGLFLMNGVEMAYNSGFLLMLPSLTNNPSDQYLFGLTQYAVPFVLGRFLAGKFLNWFPKHNLSIATGIAALGGMAAMGAMDNVYALTAALFAAETGISTSFTLSFAQTAKNTLTQDRVTSLIVASAVACAIFPVMLSEIAQHFIDMGIFTVGDATAVTLVGIPAALALYSARLFTKVENLTAEAVAKTASWWQRLKGSFKKGPTVNPQN